MRALLFSLLLCTPCFALEYGVAKNVPAPLVRIVDEAMEDLGLPEADERFPDVLIAIGETGEYDCNFALRDRGLGQGLYIEITFSNRVNWRKRPALAGWCIYHVTKFILLANQSD